MSSGNFNSSCKRIDTPVLQHGLEDLLQDRHACFHRTKPTGAAMPSQLPRGVVRVAAFGIAPVLRIYAAQQPVVPATLHVVVEGLPLKVLEGTVRPIMSRNRQQRQEVMVQVFVPVPQRATRLGQAEVKLRAQVLREGVSRVVL